MMAETKEIEQQEEVKIETPEVDEKIIKEASSQGWAPKDKFHGDEKDWVDAETFVKRGREILPILRKNNENLLKELNQTKESLKEFRVAADEFHKFQKESYERKAKELELEVVNLKAARAQAITDGDGQRVNALDDAIDSAKEEAKTAKDNAAKEAPVRGALPSAVDPKLQVWLDKNEWFGKDKRMTSMTNAIGETLRLENPGLAGDAFLTRLDEVLAEEFPQKFGKEEKRTPNYQLESGSGRGKGGSGGNSGSKRSYDNLPETAKAACDRFVKQKLMTKEAYVADYDWSE